MGRSLCAERSLHQTTTCIVDEDVQATAAGTEVVGKGADGPAKGQGGGAWAQGEFMGGDVMNAGHGRRGGGRVGCATSGRLGVSTAAPPVAAARGCQDSSALCHLNEESSNS